MHHLAAGLPHLPRLHKKRVRGPESAGRASQRGRRKAGSRHQQAAAPAHRVCQKCCQTASHAAAGRLARQKACLAALPPCPGTPERAPARSSSPASGTDAPPPPPAPRMPAQPQPARGCRTTPAAAPPNPSSAWLKLPPPEGSGGVARVGSTTGATAQQPGSCRQGHCYPRPNSLEGLAS